MWNPSPPQGESSSQGLYIIGKPLSPKYGAPQGFDSGVTPPPAPANNWVNGANDIINGANRLVFATGV